MATDLSTVRNQLLSKLTSVEFNRISEKLERVTLPVRKRLYGPDGLVEFIYFVESGIVSIVASLENGNIVEVAVVGREGCVGLPFLLADNRPFNEAVVQTCGSALRIRREDLAKELDLNPTLARLLRRYMHAFFAQVSQTAACNASHSLAERLARRLLLAHDRSDANEVAMTQEFLSMVLGVRRQGVSAAVGILRRVGAIRWGHGGLTVVDRQRLEACSCECYSFVERHYERSVT